MKIFPPKIEISDNEGFTPIKDIFNRAPFGRGLANLMKNVDEPMVVAIDAPWGSGKSTFLRMWAGSLRNEKFPVIYFDAFENDYVEDAFAAIASEVVQLASEKRDEKRSQVDKLSKKALDVGKVLLRGGLKVGVKAATLGALKSEDFEEVTKAISEETSSLEDKYLGELNYVKEK